MKYHHYTLNVKGIFSSTMMYKIGENWEMEIEKGETRINIFHLLVGYPSIFSMSSCTPPCPGGAAPHRVHPRGRPRLRRRGLEQPEDGGRDAEAGPRGAARRHAGAVLRAAGDTCWQTRVTRVPCAGVLAQQVRAPHRHVPLPHRQTEGRAYFVFSYSEAVLLFKEHWGGKMEQNVQDKGQILNPGRNAFV